MTKEKEKKSLWIICDFYTKQALVSLPYKIDKSKWEGEKVIPPDHDMEWTGDYDKAAKYPLVLAEKLKKTFEMVGRMVVLKPIFI
jgi:hypothetical protein